MKSGSLSRKISSAIKAFTDFSFLGDWIAQQVDDELAQVRNFGGLNSNLT